MAYDVIIIAGQSNAEGFGYGDTDRGFSEDPRIKQLYDRQAVAMVSKDGRTWLDIEEPFKLMIGPEKERIIKKRVLGNLADAFAVEYIEHGYLAEGREILIIKAAVGGTGFARGEWGVGSVLHRRLLQMMDMALSEEGSRISAFLWHQGECDAFELPELSPTERYERHSKNLSEMFSDIRKRYGYDFPIIAGGFCDEWYEKNRVTCDPVLTAIKDTLPKFSKFGFAESFGLASNRQDNGDCDEIHFSRRSLYKFGRRYFEKFSEICPIN